MRARSAEDSRRNTRRHRRVVAKEPDGASARVDKRLIVPFSLWRMPNGPAAYAGEVVVLALVAGVALPTISRGAPMIESAACGGAIAVIGLLERVLDKGGR